jgi:hypothetical protein
MERHSHRLVMQVQANLLRKVGACPPVMVAANEVNAHPRIHQCGQMPKNARVISGNGVPVFEPEVEEVPIQDKMARAVCRIIEPRMDRSGHGMIWDPQMKIAGQQGAGTQTGRSLGGVR